VADTWEFNGETVGYSYRIWSEQEDGVALPLPSDLEKVALDFCGEQVKSHNTPDLPGYTYKPCAVVESSCPTLRLSNGISILKSELDIQVTVPKARALFHVSHEGPIGDFLLEIGAIDLSKHSHGMYTYPLVYKPFQEQYKDKLVPLDASCHTRAWVSTGSGYGETIQFYSTTPLGRAPYSILPERVGTNEDIVLAQSMPLS